MLEESQNLLVESLYRAVLNKDIQLIKDLIKNDPNIINAIKDFGEESILHLAVNTKNLEIVEYLLKNKANIDVKDFGEETPLHFAVRDSNVDMVKCLIKNNADIDAKSSNVSELTTTSLVVYAVLV